MNEDKIKKYAQFFELDNSNFKSILSVGYQTYFGSKLALKPFSLAEILTLNIEKDIEEQI